MIPDQTMRNCGARRRKTSEVYVYKSRFILKTVPYLRCLDAGFLPRSCRFSSGCHCGTHNGTATQYFFRNCPAFLLLTLTPLLLSAHVSPCVVSDIAALYHTLRTDSAYSWSVSGVPSGGGGLGVQTPPPEIAKALQNCAKLNPICENC